MIGDLFDSPWKILIIALVIIVLSGSKKLCHTDGQRVPALTAGARGRADRLGVDLRHRICPPLRG